MFVKIFTYFALPIAVICIVTQYQKLKLLYKGLTLFSESSIVENFRSLTTIGWPYATAHHGAVAEFEKCLLAPLPETFSFKNQTYNLENWLKKHWTTGLVILKVESPTKAKLLYESYYLGNTRETKTISWSVGKSIVSALIGIAVYEGHIKSIEDDVTVYASELKNSAYEGVKIKDVLQMSSGIAFDEDYENPFSDINKMSYSLALGFNYVEFIKSLNSSKTPGTVHNYISVDTQVLGMVLKAAVGRSLTEYLEEKLWKQIGCESDCHWLLDNRMSRMELAFGTLNACTRDYARFGWLYLNKGLSPLDGKKIIDPRWIEDSISAKETHLKPDYPDKFGYGYQWWLPGQENNPKEPFGDYLAIGVYNQFIYVDPATQIVIARNSANPNYNKQHDKNNSSNIGETQSVAAYRAIAKHLSKI